MWCFLVMITLNFKTFSGGQRRIIGSWGANNTLKLITFQKQWQPSRDTEHTMTRRKIHSIIQFMGRILLSYIKEDCQGKSSHMLPASLIVLVIKIDPILTISKVLNGVFFHFFEFTYVNLSIQQIINTSSLYILLKKEGRIFCMKYN